MKVTEPNDILNELSGDDNAREIEIRKHVDKLLIQREARRRADAEESGGFKAPKLVGSLADWETTKYSSPQFIVDRVFPFDGNVLLLAQRKAGKSTLFNNLTKSLVDMHPFLNMYRVAESCRVALLNYELSDQMFQTWLLETGIKNKQAILPINLRGQRFSLAIEECRKWLIKTIHNFGADAMFIDPYRVAARDFGEEPESNLAANAFTYALDDIKAQSGIKHLGLAHHMGFVGNHGRGTSALEDWADALWYLTMDKDSKGNETGYRNIRFKGRDVDEPEEKLIYLPMMRHLSVAGSGEIEDVSFTDKEQELDAYFTNSPVVYRAWLGGSLPGRKLSEKIKNDTGKNFSTGVISNYKSKIERMRNLQDTL